MHAHIHLIKYALDQGCTISVWDDEEWAVRQSDMPSEIMDAIHAVDMAEIVIHEPYDADRHWAMVIPHGVEPDESVVDHTDDDYMNTWWDEYHREVPRG